MVVLKLGSMRCRSVQCCDTQMCSHRADSSQLNQGSMCDSLDAYQRTTNPYRRPEDQQSAEQKRARASLRLVSMIFAVCRGRAAVNVIFLCSPANSNFLVYRRIHTYLWVSQTFGACRSVSRSFLSADMCRGVQRI